MEEQNSIRKNPQHCSNCQASILNNGVFCHSCGQKIKVGRLTVKELFAQFFDNVFNLDSKIFRTLRGLFSPGKLTNAYLSGQHQKYYHPIRLFLVMILIFLAGFNYQNDFSSPGSLKKKHIDTYKERNRLMGVFDQSVQSIADSTDQLEVHQALDSLSNTFYDNSGKRKDSINLKNAMRISEDFDFFVALEDFEKYSAEEILDVYEVEGFFKRLMVQQKMKMVVQETSFMPFVMGKVPWVVFFVLLVLSLIFKLLYLKSDYLYLDHLVFSIHLNSFFLLAAAVLTLLPNEIFGQALGFTLIFLAIYFFITMKRVYKESYLKTIPKFIFVLFCYLPLFIFGIILTIIGSFLIF